MFQIRVLISCSCNSLLANTHTHVLYSLGRVKSTVWRHVMHVHKVWSVISEDQFLCLGVSTHSLGEWNQLSDATWYMLTKCDQCFQRISFSVWVWVHTVWESEINCLTPHDTCSQSVISAFRGSVSLSGCEYTQFGRVKSTVWRHMIHAHKVWSVLSDNFHHPKLF